MGDLKGLAELGKYCGLAGLALGALLLGFRDVVRTKALGRMSARHSFELLRLALVLLFSLAFAGGGAWLYVHTRSDEGLCAPSVATSDLSGVEVKRACQRDAVAARSQALSSAEAVRQAIRGLLAAQIPFFSGAIQLYAAHPTRDNWRRVVEYRRDVDGRLNKAVAALADYQGASDRPAIANPLRRLLTRRMAFLSQLDEARPMPPARAQAARQEYRQIIEGTYCAMSDFIAANGGDSSGDLPNGMITTCDGELAPGAREVHSELDLDNSLGP